MVLKSELTVAAIAERDGHFLIVEERASRRLVFNQPAGHVEEGESFDAAVVRETLEETAWTFHPQAVVGIYLWRHPGTRQAILRVAFCGALGSHDPRRTLDEGIVRAHWLTREQLVANSSRLRTPMVLRCIDDYLAGARFSLDLLHRLPFEEIAARAAAPRSL
jgi:8-oxo-dGTP pyrophosphatase MutT (NUDIX family)